MAGVPWEFDQPLCAQVGAELFFQDDRDDKKPGMNEIDYSASKRICNSCVHRIECAEWGIAHEVHGVWGGLTPQDREKIRRTRNMVVNTIVVRI